MPGHGINLTSRQNVSRALQFISKHLEWHVTYLKKEETKTDLSEFAQNTADVSFAIQKLHLLLKCVFRADDGCTNLASSFGPQHFFFFY